MAANKVEWMIPDHKLQVSRALSYCQKQKNNLVHTVIEPACVKAQKLEYWTSSISVRSDMKPWTESSNDQSRGILNIKLDIRHISQIRCN